MTLEHSHIHTYFIISVVRVTDLKKMKQKYKQFVRDNMNELKKADKQGKMFVGDKFKELKGNCFTPKLKRKFVKHFCRSDCFEVFFIVLDNRSGKPSLYENTARGFNYLLKLALTFWINHGFITNEGLDIRLDERNEKTESKHFLENYLNTELFLTDIITEKCKVTYYDSANNIYVQVADVFANLFFSQLKSNAYDEEFEMLHDHNIGHIFRFPLL